MTKFFFDQGFPLVKTKHGFQCIPVLIPAIQKLTHYNSHHAKNDKRFVIPLETLFDPAILESYTN